ncbi:MAG: ubiquitin-like domain-containing protein [Promethearchaeota archaeon]
MRWSKIPVYRFKIMGSLDERGRRSIELREDMTIAEVKEAVKKAFRMPPMMKVSLLIDGKTITDDHHKWASVAAIPRKTVILVVGTQ